MQLPAGMGRDRSLAIATHGPYRARRLARRTASLYRRTLELYLRTACWLFLAADLRRFAAARLFVAIASSFVRAAGHLDTLPELGGRGSFLAAADATAR